MEKGISIGDYLIKQIYDNGARHVFGLPGDYVLGLMKSISKSDLKIINTCDEQGAGFAADAYARMRGFGVVCITYTVGGLKIANTTAQAFAEKSPVLVISGAPGRKERAKNSLLDVVSVVPQSCRSHEPKAAQTGEPGPVQEALREALDMINSARKPAILAGVEVQRFGLEMRQSGVT